MNNNSFKIPVIIIAALFGAALIFSVVYALTKDGSEQKGRTGITPAPTEAVSASDPADAVVSMSCLIRDIDLDSSEITFMDLSDGTINVFLYTPYSDIRTVYDRRIPVSLLKRGDFVDVTADSQRHLLSAKGSADMWSYRKIFNLVIDDDLKKITISDDIYRYDDRLLILQNDSFVSLADLSRLDVFSVFGVDNYIYLIKVESGHGTLSLANPDDYIGATVRIDDASRGSVTDDYSVVLSEGTHSVSIVNGELSCNAEIRIGSGSSSVLDLLPYSREPVAYGNVHFKVSPEGALLYIDGVLTDYSKAAPLAYGTHSVEALLSGYTTYSGSLTVDSADRTITVSLSDQPRKNADVADDILYNEASFSDYASSEAAENDTGDFTDSTSDDSEGELTPFTGFETGSSSDEDSTGTDSTETDIMDDSSEIAPETEPGGSSSDEQAPEDYTEPEPTQEAPVNSPGENAMMTVQCTEGCAVFIDDVYKGEISGGKLSFKKPLGTVVVRLTKEGFTTKTYTVSLDDDGEDASFTFPGLTPSK